MEEQECHANNAFMNSVCHAQTLIECSGREYPSGHELPTNGRPIIWGHECPPPLQVGVVPDVKLRLVKRENRWQPTMAQHAQSPKDDGISEDALHYGRR